MFIDNVRIAIDPHDEIIYLVKINKQGKVTQKRSLTGYELTQLGIYAKDILKLYGDE